MKLWEMKKMLRTFPPSDRNEIFADRDAGTYRKESEYSDTQYRDRKSTRLNSSHSGESRMPSSA